MANIFEKKYHIWIPGDAKNSWNRIQCKDQIGKFNHDQDNEQRCNKYLMILSYKEPAIHITRENIQPPGQELDQGMVLGLYLVYPCFFPGTS